MFKLTFFVALESLLLVDAAEGTSPWQLAVTSFQGAPAFPWQPDWCYASVSSHPCHGDLDICKRKNCLKFARNLFGKLIIK